MKTFTYDSRDQADTTGGRGSTGRERSVRKRNTYYRSVDSRMSPSPHDHVSTLELRNTRVSYLLLTNCEKTTHAYIQLKQRTMSDRPPAASH